MTKTIIHDEAPKFIDLPMPELTFDPQATSYVAIYDMVTSEHSLFTSTADDFHNPTAVMAHFDRAVAREPDLDRSHLAMKAVAEAHHNYVSAETFYDETLFNTVRTTVFWLTQVEQNNWLFVIRDPFGEVSLDYVPATNATEFHAWVYSQGKQAVLDVVNELIAESPEEFREFAEQNGVRVLLH